ncbi:uncharacterized protein LOC134693337 [Mytilus trossulus]|uniref:uncharacterized protein LOC134693337 n=1 Tax=Mytilus trossulus TaxID=6551 RepID=UPI003005E818
MAEAQETIRSQDYKKRKSEETKLDVVCREAQIPIVETDLHVFVYLNKEIHLSADKQQSFFDCVILENKFIFTDIINSRLVIFSEENSDISYIPVPYKPWGITGIRNDAVAISYPMVHIVQIVNIYTHKVEVQIDSKNECWGLSCYKNRLYFVSGRILKIVDLMGKYKGKIMLPSDDVSCVKVDDTRLLCTDREILYRCDLQGAIFWEFRMENLAGLHGVTVDRHDNVYVAGEWSNNVVAISPDGTKCRVILTTLKGIDSPRGIYFDKKENRLLVSNCNGDKAFVFDAQK